MQLSWRTPALVSLHGANHMKVTFHASGNHPELWGSLMLFDLFLTAQWEIKGDEHTEFLKHNLHRFGFF